MMTIDQIKEQAIQLPPSDRDSLARWLIDSIDPLPQISGDYLAELRRRADEARGNTDLAIPLDLWTQTMREKLGR